MKKYKHENLVPKIFDTAGTKLFVTQTCTDVTWYWTRVNMNIHHS